MNGEMKPCPFCGGVAELAKVIIGNGSNRTGVIPENAVIYKTMTKWNNEKVYFWEKYGVTIHCTTQKCICRNVVVKFKTDQEAIDTWNRRI